MDLEKLSGMVVTSSDWRESCESGVVMMMVSSPSPISTDVKTVGVCDYQILPVNLEQVVGHILWQIENGKGSWIVTLNLDLVARGEIDPNYRKIISEAEIITADGQPIVWGAQKKDATLGGLERLTGADLTAKLIHLVAPEKIAIIGGRNPRKALTNQGLDPEAGWYIYDGMVTFEEEFLTNLKQEIAGRKLVFVALGCPKQERLIHILRETMPETTFLGIGGSFDFLAGETSRAPMWMQNYGMEWVYRIYKEPKRIGKRVFVGYIPGLRALLRDVYKRGKK
jgi:N-acetylglucosaminyldiphosphoundecaprenol N-acetyl-beta-D-mannosaminyltransferase